MDLVRQWRGVADLDRHLAFPFGLQRGDVNDDAATGVGGFPQADNQDVARNAKIFDGVAERETVRGNDANVGLAVHETGGLKGLGIDHRGINIGEDLELVRDAGVIAVAGQAVADNPVTLLRLDERLNHAVVLRHPADPAIGQDGHWWSTPDKGDFGALARMHVMPQTRLRMPGGPERNQARFPSHINHDWRTWISKSS